MNTMKQSRKNLKASLVIFLNTGTLIFGIIFLMMGFAMLFTVPEFGCFEMAFSMLFFVKYAKTCQAIDYIQEYGPLMVNHPEYSTWDYCKGVHRDREVVIKQINAMAKRKMIFGAFDASCNYFRFDEDFDLRSLMVKKGWTSALF